jgi:hypothetical protein
MLALAVELELELVCVLLVVHRVTLCCASLVETKEGHGFASKRGEGRGKETRNPIQFGLTDCGCDCNCDCDSRHLNYVPRRAPTVRHCTVCPVSALCLPCRALPCRAESNGALATSARRLGPTVCASPRHYPAQQACWSVPCVGCAQTRGLMVRLGLVGSRRPVSGRVQRGSRPIRSGPMSMVRATPRSTPCLRTADGSRAPSPVLSWLDLT